MVGIWNCYDYIWYKYNRTFGDQVSYCDSVNDQDLFIVAGVAEMLAANAKDFLLVPMDSSLKQRLLDYVDLGTRLFESRMTESNLTDFELNPVKGLNFDLGIWDDHPEHAIR